MRNKLRATSHDASTIATVLKELDNRRLADKIFDTVSEESILVFIDTRIFLDDTVYGRRKKAAIPKPNSIRLSHFARTPTCDGHEQTQT